VTSAALVFPQNHETSTLDAGSFGLYDQVSAVRTDDFDRRSTDASKLTFPIQLLILIVSSAVAASGAVWAQNAYQRSEMLGLRSDVRDIKTTMEGSVRYQGSQIESLQKAHEELVRKEALDAVRIEETRVIIAEIKGYMNGTGIKGVSK
jgi:hypothetical protein